MNAVEAYNLLHQGILALSRAEAQGIRVDIEYVQNKKQHLTRKIERMEAKFHRSTLYKHWAHSSGKNPNIHSNQQLAHFLYKTKKIKPAKTTESGQGSTDEEALLALDIPEMEELLRIRKFKKIRDTYLDAFEREQVDGYIHPSFNLHLVRTFRSSSDKPNFQNIPKRDRESMQMTRRALFPRPGHQLLEIDYSGLEVKIAACYHQDPKMLEYINDPSTDMHGDMAAQIFMIDKFDRSKPEHAYLRSAAKNGFVFPEFYGDYYGNCAEALAVKWGEIPKEHWVYSNGVLVEEGRTLAKHLIGQGIYNYGEFVEHIKKIESHFWGRRFKHYARWKNTWWEQYQERGYIEMKTGFRCSGLMSKNDCINYPVQGAAFHCLLWSFIQLDEEMRKRKWRTRLIGQIHDAIIFDVYPDELEQVLEVTQQVTCKKLPEAWKWIIVPLEVDAELCDVDASWADKKSIPMPV